MMKKMNDVNKKKVAIIGGGAAGMMAAAAIVESAGEAGAAEQVEVLLFEKNDRWERKSPSAGAGGAT